MKTVKIIILGFVVISSLQSCSTIECIVIPGCNNIETEENKLDDEFNNQELYASVNDSTSLVILNNNI
jgi:hypothetical protein